MRCTYCWREAVEDAAFCNHCGTQLQSICVNCDTFNPLDSNYCSRCGSSLPADSQRTDTPTYQEPPPSSPVHSTACPRCRKVNEPGSAYCYSCGLPLDDIDDASQRSTMQQPRYRPYAQSEAQQPYTDYAARPAGFWIRLVAGLIDVAIVVLMGLLLAGVLPGVSISDYTSNFSLDLESEITTPIWFDVMDVTLNAMYSGILVWIWSATAGKLIFGLHIVRTDGSKVGFGRALARWACYFLSLITLGIGFLMIAFRGDKRGLHDLICDTMVVRR